MISVQKLQFSTASGNQSDDLEENLQQIETKHLSEVIRHTPVTFQNPKPVDKPALKQFPILDQQTFHHSVNMTAFEILEFSGENGEDVDVFICTVCDVRIYANG